MISLFGLDPAAWRPHRLHHPERTYVETNCYTDVLIELVAAAGAEPVAMLGGTVAVDFELDQWTFFKPSTDELRRLYGIEVHEMQPYRSLPDQIAQRLTAGQTLVPEVDAWWLPDTAATSYRSEHVKTSIVAEAIDPDAEVLRYFHNAGYYELSGEDYRGALGTTGSAPAGLPPYVDLVRFDAGPRPAGDAVRIVARELLAGHLARRPARNPFEAFGDRLAEDLPELLAGDLETYHAYAFATARMAGAAFELLATHVRWLLAEEGEQPAAQLDEVVGAAKMLSFRLARRREFDVAGVVAPMAQGWQAATEQLDRVLDGVLRGAGQPRLPSAGR